MNDVMKIAMDRRAELHDEVARLDDFIRIAESLMRRLQPGSDSVDAEQAGGARPVREQASEQDREAATGAATGPGLGVTRMNLLRRGAAAPAG